VEEAGSDSKPKYLNELFILLRVVLLRPEVAKLKGSASVGSAQLWDPFKAALTVFTAKGLGKQKDLKKNHTALARLMGLALDETITAAAGGPSTTTKSSLKKDTTRTAAAGAKSTTKNIGAAGESGIVVGSVMTTTKKTKSNRPGDKEKKEAKKRRMTASAEGFTNDVTFAQVDIDIDVAPEDDDEVVQEVVGDRKKRRKDSKKTMTESHENTNGNQVESLKEEVKKKKSKKEVDNETLKEEETLSTPVDGNFKRKTCLTFKSTTFFFLLPTC
jgi:hypothetical protein